MAGSNPRIGTLAKRLLRHVTMGQLPPPLPAPAPANSHTPALSPVISGNIAAQAQATNGVPQHASVGGHGRSGYVGPSSAVSPATQGGPQHANVRKPSDQRFRSFAERYIVARAHLLTPDASKLAEEQYTMVLDAKRLYAMIERAGQNIQPEDGVF